MRCNSKGGLVVKRGESVLRARDVKVRPVKRESNEVETCSSVTETTLFKTGERHETSGLIV